jgi:Methyltransferase domain
MLGTRLIWDGPKLRLGDLLFRVRHDTSPWDGGDEYLEFFKDQKLVSQYERFFAERPSFIADNLFELGMFDGGSVIFWHEFFKPKKQVGVDISEREDSPYFARYVRSHGLRDRIKTHWSTNQGDSARLRELVKAEFDGTLDIVIDDASHLYDLTKKSFETLFPFLRPGGLYIIEDWAWDHWQDYSSTGHEWASELPLTKLITEIVEAAGTSREWISCISVFQGFAAVERGVASSRGEWQLADHIVRRPRSTLVRKSVRGLRKYVKNLRNVVKPNFREP